MYSPINILHLVSFRDGRDTATSLILRRENYREKLFKDCKSIFALYQQDNPYN